MAKIITTNKNEIIVNRFIVGKALDAFRTLVTEHKGEIGLTETKLYKATFKTNKTAKLVADTLNAQYDEHNVRMPEPKKAKGSATEPKKLTLNAFVKANPTCTRKEANAYGFEGTREELKALKKKLGVR